MLLHPSSLPGPGPIGELGPYAHAFLEWMSQAGLDTWQVLPLHPVGPGLSPYASPSAFAGDPRLISVEALVQDGVLDPVPTPWGTDAVDADAVEGWKVPLLRLAAARVANTPECDAWARTEVSWLPDWVAWAERADASAGGAGAAGPPASSSRAIHRGLQFLFARQWSALRAHARSRGIQVLGDVPLFVSGDGCDVEMHRELFQFNAAGVADPVAGVPPDYFAPLGQRWGNPTYDWAAHARTGFRWWIARIRRELELVDLVRIDHFRGLAASWAIAADEPDARKGRWVDGPGIALFEALQAALGEGALPLIAEDLGEITPDVVALRRAAGLPGMKVLQFAFGAGSDHPFLPHNFTGPDCVVYTGTHDNDTALGWYQATNEPTRDHFRRYTARDGSDPAWALLREAWASVASLAVAPMQDVLGSDSGARMNTPGIASGNWGWRLRALPWDRAPMMRSLGETYGRVV